jgi:hypothetical protein
MKEESFTDRDPGNSDGITDCYANLHKYFVRLRPWDWLNEKEIYVIDKVDGKPKLITFEFWAQEIYLDATGQVTVREFLDIARKQYRDSNMAVPAGIEKELVSILENLAYELKIIEFKDEKVQLQRTIELPLSKQ